MNKITAVIFDLDGTLLNTLDDLTAAIDYALEATGFFAPLDSGTVRRLVGNGVPKLVERALKLCGDESLSRFDECLARFTEYYGEHSADKTALYDGVAEMLDGVKARGIKTAVVTNKYDEAAQALKKRMFDCVDYVVGAREGVPPKPDPTGERLALDALGSDKEHAVHVGDGEVDILTARNAGLPVVAVTWGFRDRGELERLAPDYIIDKPSELLTLIEKIGKV